MVSIVIITLNEAKRIANTLKSAVKLSSDIVVVDSGSTDDTKAICLSFENVRFFERKWDGYSNQKNFGNEMAKYDWVLSIDADEVIDNELAISIKNQLQQPLLDAYNIRFNTYVGNTKIRFGAWNPEKHIRLFNKKAIRWSILEVHECLTVNNSHKIGQLEGRIHHYSYTDAAKLKVKAELYADLFVKRMNQIGKKPKVHKLIFSPPFTFINEYFIRLGILDGVLGFHIAYQNSRYTFLKYYKCLQI